MGLWSKISEKGGGVKTSSLNLVKRFTGYDQARDNLGWMHGLAKTLMPSSVKVGRVETFEHAMMRQEVSPERLKSIYLNHLIRFWISALIFVVGFILGISYILAGSFFSILPLIGFSAVCGSQMFSGSFRAHQIASRRFCDISEWISRPDVWVPIDFSLPAPPLVRKSSAVVVSNATAKGAQFVPPSKKE